MSEISKKIPPNSKDTLSSISNEASPNGSDGD